MPPEGEHPDLSAPLPLRPDPGRQLHQIGDADRLPGIGLGHRGTEVLRRPHHLGSRRRTPLVLTHQGIHHQHADTQRQHPGQDQ
ncbi:hypothetical protein ACFYS8_12920 [Kitasatospora sp. NPDC004615]|uniref:hypothetical protein n=1 Tax=Kitasatospora sp. NPDC004615 TaxID=3364017 RepID=UPI0036B1BDA5